MDSLCFDEEIYKKLLPVPKNHLFMKKMAKIQAIDRQIRKKWIQIKRDNQIQHIVLSDNQAFDPFKQQVIQHRSQINLLPNRDHSHMIKAQNQFRRQKILSNHKRNEQIFYGRKKKPQFPSHNENHESPTPKNQTNDFVSVCFQTPRKRIKTEPSSIKKQTIHKPKVLVFDTEKSQTTSPQRTVQLKHLSMPKTNKNEVKLPKMLLKRNSQKNRQIKILTSQSEKQLIFLSKKSQQHMKSWADHRRQMFQKLKGSKAYFIMRSPTRVMQDQGQDIFII